MYILKYQIKDKLDHLRVYNSLVNVDFSSKEEQQ